MHALQGCVFDRAPDPPCGGYAARSPRRTLPGDYASGETYEYERWPVVVGIHFANSGSGAGDRSRLRRRELQAGGLPQQWHDHPANGSGKFIRPDAAYTTGNLGKGRDELDLVPHRATLTAGNSAPSSADVPVFPRSRFHSDRADVHIEAYYHAFSRAALIADSYVRSFIAPVMLERVKVNQDVRIVRHAVS